MTFNPQPSTVVLSRRTILTSTVALAVGPVLTACGGRPEAVASATVKFLELDSVTPADGSAGTSRSTTVTSTFNIDVDPATATRAHVTLSSALGAAAATLASSGREVTLTLPYRLAPLMTYTALVKPGLTGQLGEPLLSERSSRFTTADNAWHTPVVVGNGWGNQPPAASRSASGETIVAWIKSDSTVQVVTRVLGMPATARRADDDDDANVFGKNGLKAVISPDGAVAAVAWLAYSSPRRIVVRLRLGGQWQAPQTLASAVEASEPVLQVDAAGNVLALYAAGPDDRQLHCRYYDRATGVWGNEFVVGLPNGVVGQYDLAMNGAGQALAVWVELSLTVRRLWGRPFTNGVWQGAASTISDPNDSTNIFSAPRVAVDDQGRAITAWAQSDARAPGGSALLASRWVDGQWGAAELVTRGGTADTQVYQSESGYDLAMDVDGSAMLVWAQKLVQEQVRRVFGSRFDPLTASWSDTEQISATDIRFEINYPQVSMGGGVTVVSWTQALGWSNPSAVLYRRRVAGTWGSIGEIETVDSDRAPGLSVSATGDASLAVLRRTEPFTYYVVALHLE